MFNLIDDKKVLRLFLLEVGLSQENYAALTTDLHGKNLELVEKMAEGLSPWEHDRDLYRLTYLLGKHEFDKDTPASILDKDGLLAKILSAYFFRHYWMLTLEKSFFDWQEKMREELSFPPQVISLLQVLGAAALVQQRLEKASGNNFKDLNDRIVGFALMDDLQANIAQFFIKLLVGTNTFKSRWTSEVQSKLQDILVKQLSNTPIDPMVEMVVYSAE